MNHQRSDQQLELQLDSDNGSDVADVNTEGFPSNVITFAEAVQIHGRLKKADALRSILARSDEVKEG